MGQLVKYMSADGTVIVHAVDTTDVVSEMERLHKTSATASAALGRLLTASALMGSMLKNDGETITLKLDGGGPIGSVMAISDSAGRVRGTCTEPLADLPLNEKNGKLNVGGLVGTDGSLTVIRSPKAGEQQIGQVALVSGEIAEDITSYYALSEQTPTVCALGVLVNTDLTILNAGGFLLQLLPGAGDEVIDRVEQTIGGLPSVTSMLSDGMTASDIAKAALAGFEPVELGTMQTEYRCNCSRDKMYRVLLSLGRDELRDLAAEQHITEIVCSYCNSKYEFTDEQLLEMAAIDE